MRSAACFGVMPGVFMKAVTTSNIAPLLAGGIAISCAQLGTSVPLLAAAANSAAESLAHWSNLVQVHAHAHRDRALVQVEHLLELAAP